MPVILDTKTRAALAANFFTALVNKKAFAQQQTLQEFLRNS